MIRAYEGSRDIVVYEMLSSVGGEGRCKNKGGVGGGEKCVWGKEIE